MWQFSFIGKKPDLRGINTCKTEHSIDQNTSIIGHINILAIKGTRSRGIEVTCRVTFLMQWEGLD